jgi:hypothetical protein
MDPNSGGSGFRPVRVFAANFIMAKTVNMN